MRQAEVYNNGLLAGILTEVSSREYIFRYDDRYWSDSSRPAISLTMPKNKQEHYSDHLFPFFANMLSEGDNREVQMRLHKLDREDDFGFLLATAQTDTAGAITVKPVVS